MTGPGRIAARRPGRGRGVRLAGARVLITGAGSGMGRLMALGAARRGAAVTVWDISPERALAVRRQIRAAGGRAEAQAVDVADREAVKAAAAAAGPVDVLVNNAGVVGGRTLLEQTDQAIERTINVNLLSLFWVTRAFLPGMVERGRGRVVTIASAAALLAGVKMSDYAASKAGAFAFNEALRHEMALGRTGVSTLVVCPFYVNTGMFNGVKSRSSALLPILRPEAVAGAVLRGIESGRQEILAPPGVRSARLARLLPVTLFDRVSAIAGIDASMADFKGRPEDRV